LINGDHWKAQNAGKFLKWKPIEAQRGDIYSDDGIRMLASSIEYFEIRMDPAAATDEIFDKNIYGLCIGLEKVLGTKSAKEWRNIIEGNRKRYFNPDEKGSRAVLISRKVNIETLEKLKELPLFDLHPYKGGIKVSKFFSRKKTYHELASRTIGVQREKNMVGLERSYNKALKGEDRKELMRLLPPDLWVPVETPTDHDVFRGKDVVTTIDVDIQDIMHHELSHGITSTEAKEGVAIIMDVKTGYIKAISNLTLGKNSISEVKNKAVAERIEPGSTFKAATALALLEEGVNPEEEIKINRGKKKFHDRTIYDSNYPSDDLYSTFSNIMTKSSNVGFGILANEHFNSREGKSNFYNYLQQFQLTDITDIDLLGEQEPLIKNPNQSTTVWSGVTAPYMAHGYELELTPLQVLAFYNAVANDGKYMAPRLVKEIRDNEEILKTYKPKTKSNQIASTKSIIALQKMLENVVERGTGNNIYTAAYPIAGKTGTAATNYSDVDKEQKEYNASFAGYFPADDPKYSMIIVVYDLKGKMYYGSQVAAPIFRKIADKVMILDGGLEKSYADASNRTLPRSSKGFGGDLQQLYASLNTNEYKFPRWARIESSKEKTIAQRALIRKKEVPDVRGMGLRDAMYVLENMGMKVNVKGAGKVKKQSINPGNILSYDEIDIYLN